MARRPRSFYAGLSFRPPEPVAAAARRALERRAQQPPSNRGMTPVGLARARQLIHRQELSPQTIDRMVSYFAVMKSTSRAPAGSATAKAVRPGMAGAVTPAAAGPRLSRGGWMQRSKPLNAQPIHPAAADTRADQPCNCPEPGKHRRPNDQHLKRGETDAKKIANSPHNSRLKISSL
jgi:hypothetical protein